jgi:hypothetical protein
VRVFVLGAPWEFRVFDLGAPCEFKVFVLGAPCEPRCLDALFYLVMCIIFLSGVHPL